LPPQESVAQCLLAAFNLDRSPLVSYSYSDSDRHLERAV
jgi:hypothetical protein